MKHQMKLWNDSYQAIIQGTKTIEMRLYDPKRRKNKKRGYHCF